MFNNYNMYLKELEIVNFIPRNIDIGDYESSVSQLCVDMLIVIEDSLTQQQMCLVNKIIDSIKKINSSITYRTMSYQDYISTSCKYDKILSFVQKSFNCDKVLLAPNIYKLDSKPELKKQLWQDMQDFCK